jgi:DNA primase
VSALQLQLLQRQGMKHLLIALDGDRAGQAATEKLIEQLQPQLVAGGLSASVLQLPAGEDADGLLRSHGSPAIEGLIAGARHWLEWRLDRLLAPLASDGASPTLETLQAVEQAGLALVEKLPDGVLRRSAEQQLEQALNGPDNQKKQSALSTPHPAQDNALLTSRQRLERRALRLFIHTTPEVREVVQCFSLQDPLCRLALDWLINLAVVAVDDTIARMALQLAVQLPAPVAELLAQAAAPGEEAITALQHNPKEELQALLAGLEPATDDDPAG